MTRFQLLSVVTTAATFFLIAVGGFVRAAGAGLGCPDWPRCFGRWIPPTDAGQLPSHIDPALFNFTLAWIEYVNRLVGVTIGFLILAVGIAAWRQYRQRANILWPAIGCVLLVAFQGWFGGQVVAYELDPRFVTVHLLVALVIGGLLLHLVVASFDVEGSSALPRPMPDHHRVWSVGVAALIVLLVQTVVGALLRGHIELLFDEDPDLARGQAVDQLGAIDEIHKSIAVLLVLLCGLLYALASARFPDARLRRWAQAPIWIAVIQALAGIGLASRALPPQLQLLHLVGGSLLFGCLTMTVLLLAPRRVTVDPANAGPTV